MRGAIFGITFACITLVAFAARSEPVEKAASATEQLQLNSNRHGVVASGAAGEGLRGSDLIGARLKTTAGSDYGEIHDLVIDPDSGQVRFAIVGVNIARNAQALAPVPWSALNIRSETSFVGRIDQQKLANGPEMTSRQWEDLMKSEKNVHEFPGFAPPEYGGSERIPGETDERSPRPTPKL